MNQAPKSVRTGKNFASAETGTLDEWGGYSIHHPAVNKEVEGKLFLHEALGLTGMEVSLNRMRARSMVPFAHKHQKNEELYIFLKGQGEFLVDDEIIPISPGTVIRVSPEGSRSWRNRSTEDLYYVVVQARVGTVPQSGISDGVPLPGHPRWPKS